MSEALNPYAPPKAAVDDGLAPQLELASRAARLAAAVIDLLIVIGAAVFGGLFGLLGIPVCLLLLGGGCLYTVYKHRASPGKLAMSLRVVRADGSEAEIWRIVALRWLPTGIVTFIPVWGWAVLAVDSLFIFGSGRRCVHDLLADTVVVDAK